MYKIRLCQINDCSNKYYGLGFCIKHYKKYKRYGDPNITKHHGYQKSEDPLKRRVYSSWGKMKQRCLNLNNHAYNLYGGRGIKIYSSWINNFLAFVNYIGLPPSGAHQIDRINNNGNYEPGNIRWATSAENNRNRSDVVLNKDLVFIILDYLHRLDMRVCDIARQLGLSYDVVREVKDKRNWKDVIEKYETLQQS